MPVLVNKETGKEEYFLDSEAGDLLSAGSHAMRGEGRLTVEDEFGNVNSVTGKSFENYYADLGHEGAQQSVVADRVEHFALQDKHDTLGQEVLTGLEGAARGATFGLSDAALTGLGASAENIRNRAKVNDSIALGAELVGAIAPSLLSGGAGAAGALARALPSGALAAKTGALGLKLGGGLKGAVVAGGLEGSVFGAGQAVSKLALSDEPLTAEAMFSEIGTGALLGGTLGVAGGALGTGLEKAGAGLAKVGGQVKERLVKRATPALDVTSKEGKALFQSLKASTDDLEEMVGRAVQKAETRSTTGFKFAGDDDIAEASFRALQKQKSEALDYANAASSKLPETVKKAAARVEKAEQKIALILSGRRGAVDFSKASALDQKKLGTLARAFDDYSGAMGKLAGETGVPFQAVASPVSSGIVQKLEGAGELAKAAQEAHGVFRQKLGKNGIESLVEQTPEQAMETVKALQEATDRAAILSRHIGGKDTERLTRINDGITQAIGGSTGGKLPEVAELAIALGVEEALIPNVDGPADELLKLYLATKLVGKYGKAGGLANKALSAVAGKLPGAKMLGVADGFVSDTIGKMASATGKSLDRISTGLQKTLKAGSTAVKRSSPLTTQVLSEVSFGEQGDNKKPKGKRQAFALRSDELSSAFANMPAVEERVFERLEGLRQVSPGVAEKVAAHAKASVEFLYSKMPKDKGVLQRFGKSQWRPTDGELDKFARYVHAVKDPAGIIERFGDFRMTREDAEVLQSLYPAHYQKAQHWVMENMDKLADKSTYKQRVQMSLFMNTPADPIMARAAVWQSHFAPAQEQSPQGPKLGGTNQESETAAQQLQEMK